MQTATEVAAEFAFLESPRWRAGWLYLSDLYTRRVLRVDPDGNTETVVEIRGEPSGLGWLPGGELLVVEMAEQRILRLHQTGETVVHADLSAHVEGSLNEMVVAEDGTAYVGSFGFDVHAGEAFRATNIHQVSPDGAVASIDGALDFPNGMAFVDDLLVIGETMGNRLSAFRLADGGVGPRTTWAAFGPRPTSTDHIQRRQQADVVADGICSDRDGAVWVANAAASEVLRVKAGGAITDVVSTAPLRAYACALGGPDRRTLYICAAPDSNRNRRAVAREGRLLAARVDVPGSD